MRGPYTRLALSVVITTTFVFIIVTALRTKDGKDVLPKLSISEPLAWFEQDAKEQDADQDGDAAKWAQKNSDYRVLTSIRNNRGYYNMIDISGGKYKIFNPTILELPRDGKFKHDFLVIARVTHVGKVINGKKYWQGRQIATFANLEFASTGRPLLKIDNGWSHIMLENYGSHVHHCRARPKNDIYIGPEDMKLFWTAAGEPLVIFTHQIDDKFRCQGQFIIDVRAAVPKLAEILNGTSLKMPPIRFNQPVALRREALAGHEDDPRYQREKNWAPLQGPFADDKEELLFMVEPGQLYRLGQEGSVDKISLEEDQISAVEAPYPPYIKAKDTWRSKGHTCLNDVMLSDSHVHQATPMLSLTLCNRGTCKPTTENTVMLGMVHHRTDKPTWYDRRIITYSPIPPYNMLSVSKLLSYHGEVQDKTFAWTGSMTYFMHHKQFPLTSHGFLDDEVWLSFGINDKEAGWLDVRASDLVADYYLCQGASLNYRMRLSNT